MITKLKAKDLADFKKAMCIDQGHKCCLCGESLRGIPMSKVALDHCHETGHVRGVLHMGCNRVEGIILKALTTWARQSTVMDKAAFLDRLQHYWIDNRKNPKPYIYHTHKTPEQEAELKLKRARAAAKKRRAAAIPKGRK